MDYKELFDDVRNHTRMYVRTGTYDEVAAFVLGCDAANDFCLLHGFREWLVLKVDGYDNFVWTELVLRLAFPGSVDPSAAVATSPANNRVAINALFDMLSDFFVARGVRHERLKDIFCQYQAWLERRERENDDETE